MRKIIITCDFCGREIEQKRFANNEFSILSFNGHICYDCDKLIRSVIDGEAAIIYKIPPKDECLINGDE